MTNYITIDGGTTNTRICLVQDRQVTDMLKFNVGASGGEMGRAKLKEIVKNGIKEILARNNLRNGDIERILASGMITSEFGLYALPHSTVPVGKRELKQTAKELVLHGISSIPFVCVRGVKTDGKTAVDADMLRGEETELMGLCGDEDGACVYMLMGSHTKIIKTDASGKITNFTTMLTGELIAAISGHTILKSAVNLEKSVLIPEYLEKGYSCCKQLGINAALFKVRILKNMFDCSEAEIYSFFMGILLCDEVSMIANSGEKRVVLGGNKPLREALAILLKTYTDAEIICLSDEVVNSSVALGAVRIYEEAEA